MGYDLKELIDYFDKHGVNFIVDLNPSPEKIKAIKESLKRRTKLEKIMKKEFDNL
jgi:sugar/nucleoside kinase (ribokinase family)